VTRHQSKTEPVRLLIATTPAGKRLAVARGNRLVDFRVVHNTEAALIGQVSLGRIMRIDRGLEAAFVDCGGGQAGFLPLRDGPPGITEGQRLIVQAIREPFDGKAMRLTARPVMAGYRLSYAPFSKNPTFPDGITEPEKLRLQKLLGSLDDLRQGMSVHASAVGADTARLRVEAAALRRQWVEVERRAAAANDAGSLQAAPDFLLDLIRELGPSLAEIICDTRTSAGQVAILCQSLDDALSKRVVFRPRREWVPSVAELEEQIDEALADEVVLPSGAALHVSETRAMTVIDVDSSQARLEGVGAKAERSFLKVNLEAAPEIAHQIRLRNLGGIVVVDFIDLRARDLRQRVIDAMRAAVTDDPQPVWVGGMSRLGLVELTRQRRGPTLAARLLEDCKACAGRPRVPREDLRPWIGHGI
jgi:Rne/Rng family ribonuclease